MPGSGALHPRAEAAPRQGCWRKRRARSSTSSWVLAEEVRSGICLTLPRPAAPRGVLPPKGFKLDSRPRSEPYRGSMFKTTIRSSRNNKQSEIGAVCIFQVPPGDSLARVEEVCAIQHTATTATTCAAMRGVTVDISEKLTYRTGQLPPQDQAGYKTVQRVTTGPSGCDQTVFFNRLDVCQTSLDSVQPQGKSRS